MIYVPVSLGRLGKVYSSCKNILIFAEIALYHYEVDAAIKESRKEPLFKETIPFYLKRLDDIVKSNNGYLAVGRVCIIFNYIF